MFDEKKKQFFLVSLCGCPNPKIASPVIRRASLLNTAHFDMGLDMNDN